MAEAVAEGVADEIELQPEQPAAVRAAVTELLVTRASDADPWWQAGLDESLRTDSSS